MEDQGGKKRKILTYQLYLLTCLMDGWMDGWMGKHVMLTYLLRYAILCYLIYV